eukprot:scaffold27631_cov24-Tisochrysis_lutea.AAC.3
MPRAARELCSGLLQREVHARVGARCGVIDLMPYSFLGEIDWLALASRQLDAPVLPVVSPAEALELSDIEALLRPTGHAGSDETEDPFAAAAAADHLFIHDFTPCDETPANGRRAAEPPSPRLQSVLAKQLPRL